MVKQSVSIVNFQILYNILYEVKEILRFEVINFEKEQDFIEDKTNKLENNLIIFGPNINFSLFQDRVDTRKVFVSEKFPIDLKKLIENINIQLIKQKYGYQSNIRLKNYTLDLNSRFITSENKNLKLTEREIDIILFLNEHDVPKNVINLQKEVWGHSSKLETHTVETHIYRLRKKIKDHFNDKNFILSHDNGYFIS